MRTISGILQLVGLLVLLVAGYWTWYAGWGPNPRDRVGTALTHWVPGPLRDWGCGKLNQRFAAEAPPECGSARAPAASEPATPDEGGASL
jgi:hypothetical protein